MTVRPVYKVPHREASEKSRFLFAKLVREMNRHKSAEKRRGRFMGHYRVHSVLPIKYNRPSRAGRG